MYYAQVLQSLDSSLIGIQVELILCTQCLTLLPKVCCSFIKTSNFFSNKISPLLNWIMKYDIVRMLSRLLLSKEKYAPFFPMLKDSQEQFLYLELERCKCFWRDSLCLL